MVSLNSLNSLKNVKLILWAGFHDRVPLAVVALNNRGIRVTVPEAHTLIDAWSTAISFGSNTCFFCEMSVSRNAICGCYNEVALPLPKPHQIRDFSNIPNWESIKVGTYQCTACPATVDIPLGVVAARYARVRAWTTPKLCKRCWDGAKRPTPDWRAKPDALLEYIENVFVTGHENEQAQAGE